MWFHNGKRKVKEREEDWGAVIFVHTHVVECVVSGWDPSCSKCKEIGLCRFFWGKEKGNEVGECNNNQANECHHHKNTPCTEL